MQGPPSIKAFAVNMEPCQSAIQVAECTMQDHDPSCGRFYAESAVILHPVSCILRRVLGHSLTSSLP